MLTRLEREHERDGREFITLGVRATNGKLAGSGRILHDGSVGLMCDFGVTPSHRSQGIGKALIVARMGLAESSDIRSLVTDPLMPTNPLSKFYIEQGFEPEPDGRLIYTTDPAAVDAFYEKIRERSA
jgi:GNAT superfamily N-acetyltransferase